MDDALLAELAAIVGPERFISGDPVRLEPFGHDEVSGGAGHTRLPDAVVFPETEEEIRQIVTLADLHRFPVTVRGGGTAPPAASFSPRNGSTAFSRSIRRA